MLDASVDDACLVDANDAIRLVTGRVKLILRMHIHVSRCLAPTAIFTEAMYGPAA